MKWVICKICHICKAWDKIKIFIIQKLNLKWASKIKMSSIWQIMGMQKARNKMQIMLVWLACTTLLISKEAKTLGSTKVTKSQVIKRLGSKVRFNPWEDRLSREIRRGLEVAHLQDKGHTITCRQMTIDIQKSFRGALTRKDSLV